METAAAFEMLKPQCNGHSSVFPAFLWSYGCGSCGEHSTEVNWKLKSTQSIKNKVQAQPCRRFKHQKHQTILKNQLMVIHQQHAFSVKKYKQLFYILLKNEFHAH